jgi:hypothetical protein
MESEAVEGLGDCGTCNNRGWILCDHEGTGRDEEGWCTRCSAPADEVRTRTLCPTCEP